MHTMSEHVDDNPHVILTADSDQSEYTRRIEERLAELERTVERLGLEKVKFAKSEEIIDVSSRILPLIILEKLTKMAVEGISNSREFG